MAVMESGQYRPSDGDHAPDLPAKEGKRRWQALAKGEMELDLFTVLMRLEQWGINIRDMPEDAIGDHLQVIERAEKSYHQEPWKENDNECAKD